MAKKHPNDQKVELGRDAKAALEAQLAAVKTVAELKAVILELLKRN